MKKGQLPQTHSRDLQRSIWLLYAANLFTSWGDRMWEFASVILVYNASPNSLLPASLWGLASTLFTLVFSPALGRALDHIPRLRAIGMLLCTQNILVAISSILLAFAISFQSSGNVVHAPAADALSPSSDADFAQHFPVVDSLLDGGVSYTPTPAGGSSFSDHPVIIALLVVAGLLSAVSAVASAATDTAMGKDWVVVIAAARARALAKERNMSSSERRQRKRAELARVSSVIRASNLTCQILAPALYAAMASYASQSIAALGVAGWNLVSMFFEWWLREKVYRTTPELQAKPCEDPIGVESPTTREGLSNFDDVCATDAGGVGAPHITTPLESPTAYGAGAGVGEEVEMKKLDIQDDSDVEGEGRGEVGEGLNGGDEEGGLVGGKKQGNKQFVAPPPAAVGGARGGGPLGRWLADSIAAVRVYLSLPELYCSLAYAVLFPSVINWGAMMTAYLQWSNVSLLYVAVGRAGGAFAGVLGALLFARAAQYVRVGSIATATSLMLIVAVAPVVAVLMFASITAFTPLMILGVALSVSRLFLWSLDMALNQLIQENVPSGVRMTFGGVHTAIVNALFLLSYLMVTVFSNPEVFYVPCLISLFFVAVSFPLVCVYLQKRPQTGAVTEAARGGDGETSGSNID